MRFLSALPGCALGAAVLLASVHPAFATRPTCRDLLAAQADGQPADEVARAFGTTQARLAACAFFSAQRQRFDRQREHVETQRLQRGTAVGLR
jgi:hypothetical protein